MKLHYYLTFLLLSLTVFASGQDQKATEKNYIEVTGRGELEIIPDEIYISITLKERQEGKKKVSVETQESELKSGMQQIGIALENLTLSDANSDYVKVSWTKKDVITKKNYILKVSDATEVGKVFEKLDALKIQDAYIARVSHTKIEEYKKQVRIMAIKAAKDKAEYLLIAIDEKMGKPIVVYEQNGVHNVRKELMNLSGVANVRLSNGYDYDKSEPEIQFKKIKLQAAIYVKFEIL